jgi:hypothetical protein
MIPRTETRPPVAAADLPPAAEGGLPGWYLSGVDEVRRLHALEGFAAVKDVAAGAAKGVEDAFDKFAFQARNLSFLFVAVLSVAAGLLTLALKDAPGHADALLASAGAMLLVAGHFARHGDRILRSCYDRYTAGVLWASQVHLAIGLGAFEWYAIARRVAARSGTQREFFDRWLESPDAVYNRYAKLLRGLRWTCLLAGLGLIGRGGLVLAGWWPALMRAAVGGSPV